MTQSVRERERGCQGEWVSGGVEAGGAVVPVG